MLDVFAGFVDHADHHIGRVISSLDEMGIRDNALIMLVSDNGDSQEGLQNGTLSTDRYRNYFPDTVEELLGKLDEAGSASLACSGGEFGGWTLFAKDSKFRYSRNYLKLIESHVSSSKALAPGKHALTMNFIPTEKHLKPDYFIGDVMISVDGERVGGLKGVKVAGQYSSVTGYGLLIGRNAGTPVSHEYKAPFAFTGKREKVLLELK